MAHEHKAINFKEIDLVSQDNFLMRCDRISTLKILKFRHSKNTNIANIFNGGTAIDINKNFWELSKRPDYLQARNTNQH